jgi:hypothetical protein
MGAIGRFFSWSVRQLVLALLVAVAGVAGLGLWAGLRDPAGFEARRTELVRALTAETVRLRAALAGAETRMAATRVEIAAQQDRAAQAAKVARDLAELNSGLNRLTASFAQVRENDERLARMKQMSADSLVRVADLQENLQRTQWEKDGLEIALARARRQRTAAEADTPLLHYARAGWNSGGRMVLGVAALVVFGPSLWRRFRRARRGVAERG